MLNVAVIGIGNMGRHHIRHYSLNPNANLVAVCDLQQDLLDQYTSKYNCKGYTNLDEMLENESIDAVTIAAATFVHYDLAKKVIEKGIHVLIEKPIAETEEKGNALVELAKDHGVTLMIGHIERFNPAVQKLKEMLAAGTLGDIKSAISRRVGPLPKQIKDANVLVDLAVHDLDILTYLMDEKPSNVTIQKKHAQLTDRADCADILVDFSGASGYVQVNWTTPKPIRTLFVTCTKGYVELNYATKELVLFNFSDPEPQNIEVENKDQLAEEIAHFLNCAAQNITPLITGEDGVLALAMIK
jgi:UDP-N-acetylglucosamine 3-dehydrogenase